MFFKLEWPNGVEFLYFGLLLIKRHISQVGSELYWHKHTYVIMRMAVDQFIYTGISERITLCRSSWNSSGSTKPTKWFNPQKELYTNKKHWHGWEISEWQTAGKERVLGQWLFVVLWKRAILGQNGNGVLYIVWLYTCKRF